MKNIIMDLQDLKNFLTLYNRFLFSILSEFNREKLPEELFEDVLDELVTKKDLDWLYTVYQKSIKQKNQKTNLKELHK
jgi:hypothetical protein